MTHHDASMRRTNTQLSSNRRRTLKEHLRSLRVNTQLPALSSAFGSRRTFTSLPPRCLRPEDLPAMRMSTASRKALRSTEQPQMLLRSRCSTLPICSKVQTCRDNRRVLNTSNTAARAVCIAWASQLSRRRSRNTSKSRAMLSDRVPRLRHWRLNLGFRRRNTTLQASQFRQVRPRPSSRRRTYRRNISSLHTRQLALHLRRHTAIR